MTLVWILLIALLLIALVMFLSTVVIFEKYFTRFETPRVFYRSLDEFPGLTLREFTVVSDRGQKLAAYDYRHPEVTPQAVLILAHGLGGGGHNTYRDVADFFARQGFIVISYDATGNDKSEGKSVRGLQQGYIDLAQVIRYVKNDPELSRYPRVLFGHSWGGYAVGNALNLEPEVDAVVSVAGFNDTLGMVEHFGSGMVGPRLIRWILPMFRFYEKLKFGHNAARTAAEGFAESKAKVLILHSRDDDVVPARYGYDIYKEKFGNDPRFRFKLFDNRGHGYIYYAPESKAYTDRFFKDYAARFKDKKTSEHEKKAYLEQSFDRSRAWIIDETVLFEITAFYRTALSEM